MLTIHTARTSFLHLLIASQLGTLNKCHRTLEGAAVEFIDEDGDGERGPGVRLRYGSKLVGKRK